MKNLVALPPPRHAADVGDAADVDELKHLVGDNDCLREEAQLVAYRRDNQYDGERWR